jgi:hypothetical protein
MPYDPNKIPFVADPEIRTRLEEYTLKKGFGMKGRGKAINKLLDLALKSEGF